MTIERTIAFVDLAGFTALTEVHGDDTAVNVLDIFTAAAVEIVARTGAELVKTIGDAVMLAAPKPRVGLDAVQQIFEACYASGAFPEPRGGLHHGPVVARDGDYFGATVNLAARLAGRASSGQTLATADVAQVAGDAGFGTVELGRHQLRNILEPVALWAVELCPTHIHLSIDPVCRMRVSCDAAIARVRHAGSEHWLCSLDCLRAFAADPDRYVTT